MRIPWDFDPIRLGSRSGLIRVRGMDEAAVQIRPQTSGGSFTGIPISPTGDKNPIARVPPDTFACPDGVVAHHTALSRL